MATQPTPVQQAFKYALDPTPAQQRELARSAAAARFAFNWGLDRVKESLDRWRALKDSGVDKPDVTIPGHFDLCKLWTVFKNGHQTVPYDEDGQRTTAWLNTTSSGTFQAALRDCDQAMKNFVASRKGTRKGKPVGFPTYKSRRSRPSYQVHGGSLYVADAAHVRIPKIGLVKLHEPATKLLTKLHHPPLPCPNCDHGKIWTIDPATGQPVKDPKTGDPRKPRKCQPCKGSGQREPRIIRGTLSQDSRGRWHIALTVDIVRHIRTNTNQRQRHGGLIGVDFGTLHLVTCSDGTMHTAPQPLQAALRKLQRLNRELARRQSPRGTPQSANWHDTRKRLARTHARVASLRLDFVEKLTSQLARSHEVIVVEGWDAQLLAQNGSAGLPKHVRKLRNRRLADSAVGMLRWKLEHKCAWYGSRVLVADPHTPTGRTCSGCGHVADKPVPPARTDFVCSACGLTVDRRMNSARVLAAWGRSQVETSAPGLTRAVSAG